MGLKEVSKAIKQFVGGRRALLEVTVGPSLERTMQFDADTIAYPLGTLGNSMNIEFTHRLLRSLGISTDQKFTEGATELGASFNSLVAITYAGLDDQEFESAAWGLSKRADRYRALLGLYTGGEHVPILRVTMPKPNVGNVQFQMPRYSSTRRQADDPISLKLVKACANECYDDDQLHFFILMLEQIHSLQDHSFRMARYFSVLEAMAGQISSQFQSQSGDGTSNTRTAIRFMIGYFSEFDVPRFTISPDRDFEFDHIELAGRVRDKLFHGGGELPRDDVPSNLRPGVDLLSLRPEMISYWLSRDCEREIERWSTRKSRGWLAQNGTSFKLPVRDPRYDGRELAAIIHDRRMI